MKLTVLKQTEKSIWEGHTGDQVLVNKEELRLFLDKVHLTMTEMMPAIKHLAYNHIKELNEVLIELDQARHTVK
jgi:hypothetical protein